MLVLRRLRRYLRALGPGVITGASDNDPAGISTYSVAGASAGYTFLWLAILAIPLMIAVQDMSARVGAVCRRGLGSMIGETYGRRWFLIALIALLVMNITTIGADLAGMSAALNLLTGVSLRWFVVPIAVFILAIQIFWSYRAFARYIKYLTVVLFAYVFAGLLARPDAIAALQGTFIPSFDWSKQGLAIAVGVLGTTISPYMFFWQASEETEEIREEERRPDGNEGVTAKSEKWRLFDTAVGMIYSNFISYFIILASAATLHKAGISIETASQAAEALRPIAGSGAFILFSIGIIGSGLIAIPVLAGSTAYPLSEWMRCPEGLDKRVHQARCFYMVITASVLVGAVIAMLPINPISTLFYSQVLMGLLTPVLVALLVLITRNKSIMGASNMNTPVFNFLGWFTVAIMTLADVAMIWTFIAR